MAIAQHVSCSSKGINKRGLLLILALVLCCTGEITAQKEANIWYFGAHAGLDFNSGSPVALTNGAMNTSEGCASIADSSGNLLFYTDGTNVWNANHQVMSNGTGLLGHSSSTQSAIIVPHPTNANRYYIFTMDHGSISSILGNGLHYSEVDMSASGGLGSVTSVKNVNLIPGMRSSEKLTAVKHNNGRDFWIITHGSNSNTFYAFELTSAGVNSSAIISNVGSFYNMFQYQGYLKASPDGKKLAAGILGVGIAGGRLEILDFDNSTGVISNPAIITTKEVYGVEFSPNASLIYAYIDDRGNTASLSQYNLNAGSTAAISASEITIASRIGGPQALQLGPDNKIYCTSNHSSYLDRINHPDSIGVACDFKNNDVFLQSGSPRIGLPNFLARFQPPFYHFERICLGDTTFFRFNDVKIIAGVQWNFGDPASGASNVSSDTEPFHIYSDTGKFIAEAIVSYFISPNPVPFSDTLRDTLRILPVPLVDLGSDTSLCWGDTLIYDVDIGDTSAIYQWHNNASKTNFVVTTPGNYWVNVSNSCGADQDTVSVQFIDSLEKTIEFEDTVICKNDIVRFDAFRSGLQYLWQDSTTLSFIDVSQEGQYWVEWQNECESVRDTFSVIHMEPILLELGNDTMICFGDTLLLDAGQTHNASYTWQDGSEEKSIHATEAGTYWVNVENQCESLSDTLLLNLLFPPDVYLGNDTVLCRYNSFLLDAENHGASYVWQDGSTGRYMNVNKEGEYWVDVTNECALSNDSLLATLTYKPNVFLGNDTTLCEGQALTLNAFYEGATYHWQDNSNNSRLRVTKGGIYEVEVRNSCGVKKDMIEIFDKICDCEVYIPNSFTPNGDGINEVFKVYHQCEFSEFELHIYNRWGGLVYQSKFPSSGWDGSAHGENLQTDTYVWLLRYSAFEGDLENSKTLKGVVNLMR